METPEVPHVMPCLFPIRPCCTPGKSLAPIAATDHCDPAAYRKEFKEIYMDGLLRLLRQAKRRMLSRRGQHASLSYNMSLLPDSSRGSVLLRNTRMGNNVPKEQVAPGQGVHHATIGTGYSGTRRSCPTSAGTSTQYPGKICITFGDRVPVRQFHAVLA
jgi:hypothetical protein